jgi:hypothetical protein
VSSRPGRGPVSCWFWTRRVPSKWAPRLRCPQNCTVISVQQCRYIHCHCYALQSWRYYCPLLSGAFTGARARARSLYIYIHGSTILTVSQNWLEKNTEYYWTMFSISQYYTQHLENTEQYWNTSTKQYWILFSITVWRRIVFTPRV